MLYTWQSKFVLTLILIGVATYLATKYVEPVEPVQNPSGPDIVEVIG